MRQVTRFPGDAQTYTLNVGYRTDGQHVIETNTAESDGSWSKETFSPSGYGSALTWGHGASTLGSLAYERESDTNIITGITATCHNRSGRMLSHSRVVSPGEEDQTEWDLLNTQCDWSKSMRGR